MNKKTPPSAAQIARRSNLFRLVGDKHGDIHTFAEKHGLSEQLLYQVRNNRREIGERLARKIEGKLKLTTGWLDTQFSGEVEADPFFSLVAAEISARNIPKDMQDAILFMLKTAPPR